MAITNTNKASSSIVNASKVSIGETWASITSTWEDETRTWLGISQLLTNISKVASYPLWSALEFPWLLVFPWMVGETGITNLPKP